MRPSRLIVGEVRQEESLDLLIALNSGLPGMCSVHANSAREAVVKLCTLPLLAGENVTDTFVVPTVAACIDLVVQIGVEPPHADRFARHGIDLPRCWWCWTGGRGWTRRWSRPARCWPRCWVRTWTGTRPGCSGSPDGSRRIG